MPYKKRRKCNNENTKEKKAIATRLMVISLKVDDYIYKNKPISSQEAQLYIEEIATYKLKCVNDVRSLQVIEKLTILMKSIINENNVRQDSNENLNTESTTKADAIEITNVTKKLPNSVSNIDKENAVEKDNNIDFNNYDNHYQNKSHTEHHNIEMKTFTDVTINHTIINFNDDTNNVQSPTLIDERNANGKELNSNSIILFQNNQNKITHLTIAGNDIKDFERPNVIGNNDNSQNIQNSFNCDGEIDKNKQNLNTKDVETCESFKNNNEINDIPKDNDKKDKIEPTVKNSKRKPKNKTVRTKKAFKASDTDKNLNKNKISKKKCVVAKKNSKSNNTKNKSDLSQTLDSHNNSVKNKITSKLYKETEIIEDLSWVENIKYVREVRKEEYDLKTLEETFWTDFTLPVDFNLNDFDYID